MISVGVQGILNIMIGLEMKQGEPVGQSDKQYIASESSWSKTNLGGLFTNTCTLNGIFEKDEKVGELRNSIGEKIEELYTPYKSIIFDTRYHQQFTLETGQFIVEKSGNFPR